MESSRTDACSKGRQLLGIDRRSLALFRIGLGAMLFADVIKRSLTLREHYTAEGFFPREIASQLTPDFWLFRVYLISDDPGVQAIFLGIAAILAILVVVGYRTKLVTVLSFVMLVSIIRRNPYATHTGDIWLEALTFWAMFLPLGVCFSVDRLRGRAPGFDRNPILTVGTAAILVQIGVFYLSAGVLKHGYDLWQRGEALQVFTGIVEYTRPFGTALGRYPTLCRILTYGTLALETGGPFLLFLPYRTAMVRMVSILLFAGFHLGIQLSVYIGIFEILSIIALSLFLPAWFWDELLVRTPMPRLFQVAQDRLWPLVRRWSAPGAPVVSRIPLFLRRVLNRSGQALAALSLSIVLVSNYNAARGDTIPIPASLDGYARQIGLIQNWNIFTDLTDLFFGWYVVVGQTDSGRLVDVIEDHEFAGLVPPEHPAAFFRNHNSRRFWGQAARPGQEWLRVHLARSLARRWDEEHVDRLFHLAIFHVARAPGRGQKKATVRRLHVMEAPRPELRTASPEEQARALELRAQWRRFLAEMPETLRS